MIRVIINADDLGKSHEVNSAIADALQKKIITSSTILANNDTWDEVHQIVEENKDASFGVHLNLTEGKALTDSPVLHNYNIVDKNNCFTDRIRDISAFPDDLLQAVYDEWDAQIDKVAIVEGISISHFDGHHHVHTISGLVGVLCRLGKKYHVYKVRNRYYYPRGAVYGIIRSIARIPGLSRIFNNVKGGGKLMPILQREADNALWQRHVKTVFKTTDCFNSYESQVAQCTRGVKLSESSIIELMCHPGHPGFSKEYDEIKEKRIEGVIGTAVRYTNYRVL